MTRNEVKEIDRLVKMLKQHGVETFERGDLKLKISPMKYFQPLQDVAKASEKVTDEDLYYSSTTLKPRTR